MSESPFYLLKPARLEPASSARSWLGRIVQNYGAPDAGFTPANPSRFFTDPPTEIILSDVSSIFTGTMSSKLSAQISGIASASRSRDKTDGTDFATSSITCMRLPNYGDVFDSMVEDVEVRNKLGRMLSPGGEPCYMIVALLIWTDATFRDTQSQSGTGAMSGTVPVSMIASAAAGAPITVPDPELCGSVGNSAVRTVKGTSEGRHIFAFEYKAVRRRAYSLFANFTPKLGDHGPRVEGGRLFGTDETIDKERRAEEEDLNLALEVDDDDVGWTLTVDDAPEVEELDDFAFAFDD